MMINIYGPGHYIDSREVASRPDQLSTDKGYDTWFGPCVNSDPNTGTKISHQWLNLILDTLRSLVRSAGAAQNETALDMAAEAAARYASGGVYYIDSGTQNYAVLSASGSFIAPKSLFRGMMVCWTPIATNTGPATAVVAGLASKPILMPSGAALPAGVLLAGVPAAMCYDPSAALGAGAFLLVPWALPSARVAVLNNATVYATAGAHTFTAPITGRYRIRVWGGGGGGGYGQSSTNAGGGGAGGGYAEGIVELTAGQEVTATVGGAGTGGNGGPAGAGGTTSFGSYISATGGVAGNAAGGGLPGQSTADGGVGSLGRLNLVGGRGGEGDAGALACGGAGGAAPLGGAGAPSRSGTGDPGTQPGGGGSGGGARSLTNAPGGPGALGMIVIEWLTQ